MLHSELHSSRVQVAGARWSQDGTMMLRIWMSTMRLLQGHRQGTAGRLPEAHDVV